MPVLLCILEIEHGKPFSLTKYFKGKGVPL